MTILSIKIGSWRFTVSMTQVQQCIGVYSTLPDGKHILMWDFDNVGYKDVINSLRFVQKIHLLPKIYVFNTGNLRNWCAWCFKRMEWQKAFAIVASTEHVDWGFIRYSAIREKFTLRVSPKGDRRLKLATILDSPFKEDAVIDDLRKWVMYETLSDNAQYKVYCLDIDKNHVEVKVIDDTGVNRVA